MSLNGLRFGGSYKGKAPRKWAVELFAWGLLIASLVVVAVVFGPFIYAVWWWVFG